MSKEYVMIERTDMKGLCEFIYTLLPKLERMVGHFTGKSIVDPNDTDWEVDENKGFQLGDELRNEVWDMESLLDQYHSDDRGQKPYFECLITEKEVELLAEIEDGTGV